MRSKALRQNSTTRQSAWSGTRSWNKRSSPTIKDTLEILTVWVRKLAQLNRTPYLLEDREGKVIVRAQSLESDTTQKLMIPAIVWNFVDVVFGKVVRKPEKDGSAQRMLQFHCIELGAQ
jgi:hypothetical protein